MRSGRGIDTGEYAKCRRMRSCFMWCSSAMRLGNHWLLDICEVYKSNYRVKSYRVKSYKVIELRVVELRVIEL